MGLQWVDLGSLRLSSLPPGGETHRKSHIFQKRRVCDTAYILSLARTWDRTHVRGALFPAALSERTKMEPKAATVLGSKARLLRWVGSNR